MSRSTRSVPAAVIGLTLLLGSSVATTSAAGSLDFVRLKSQCEAETATVAPASDPATAPLWVPAGRLDGPQEVDPSFCGVDWKHVGCCGFTRAKLHCSVYYCCRTRPDGVRECGMFCEADWCTAVCEL